MKHLLFSYHTCPMEEPGVGLAGGMNVFLRSLLPGLAAHGIETDVLTRGKGGRVEVSRPFPGVRVIHVPCGWSEPAGREAAYRALSRFARAARRLLREGGPPGAVSAHYWMSGIAARDAWAWDGGPALVFAYHTVEARKPRAGNAAPDALSAARATSEERLAREAGRIVFLSEQDRVATRALLPSVAGKATVIPPGVDDAFRRPPTREAGRRAFRLPQSAFVFLLAARPDPGKGVSEAVGAFLALRGRVARKPLLVVAGQEAPAGSGAHGVVSAGPVPHADMPFLFAAADAVVCPSAYESFGLVPLEAMAAGVPVIVPRGGFWGSAVRREGGGAIFPAGSVRGLTAAMAGVMGDGPGRARMAREGRRIAARFTWERCSASWARLLSSVARRDSPRGTRRARAGRRRRSSAAPGAS